jgi:aspartyl/asparaginyl beta-hydroxylase (cupin superfamily)
VVAQSAARGEAAREAALAARGFPPGQRSPRFAEALDIMAGRSRIFVQQPTDFYFPGLAQTPFFDTAAFDWVAAVEAETDAIRAELDGLRAAHARDFRPYIHGDPNRASRVGHALADDPDWSALFLCENGVRSEAAIEACPRTWAAMQAVPFPAIANSPTVMFSLLRPGARIMPHTGMFNTRLVCHLPLIIPPGCRFRVGNEVRAWQPGRLMIFDDSIEHEAWNDSDEDRVVLIFDIWRPDLTAQERSELAALFAGKLD